MESIIKGYEWSVHMFIQGYSFELDLSNRNMDAPRPEKESVYS